jgi:uncharacterized protein YycO
MISNLFSRKRLGFKLAVVFLALPVVAVLHVEGGNNRRFQLPSGTQEVRDLLAYPFDSNAPMGSAQNPAVIIPAASAFFVDHPVAKKTGDLLLIPVAEVQKVANQPFARTLAAPILSQLTNVKSFDGFSAVDTTSLGGGPSSILRPANAVSRRISGDDPTAYGKLLRDGDLVFGSHVVNWMTWGKYIHVAIVVNASGGKLIESTADGPSEKPGVREIDWARYEQRYGHVGIVRVKGASPDQITRVIRWVEQRKGLPYRWPIIMGLDNNDESRFYCSQLVWRAYKQSMNVDLDSDRGALVFPDDLYHSKDVDIIVP